MAVVVATGWFAIASASASGSMYSASRADDRDPSVTPSRDIERVASTFDDATGEWITAVTLFGAPSSETSASLYLAITGAASANCDTAAGWRAHTDPAEAGATYGSTAETTKAYTSDGRTLVLRAVDPGLVGKRPCPVSSIRLSKSNVIFDEVADVPFAVADPAAPPVVPTPPPTQSPTPPPAAKPYVFTTPGVKLTRGGRFAITVSRANFTGLADITLRVDRYWTTWRRVRISVGKATTLRGRLPLKVRRVVHLQRRKRAILELKLRPASGDSRRTTRRVVFRG